MRGLFLISSQEEFRETPARTPCLGGSRCKLCPSLEASGAGQTGSEQEARRALSATEQWPVDWKGEDTSQRLETVWSG